MDFPHINDDKFPHINTVDVWKYQNDFDYARWQGKTSIKLLNVLWNSNYADVPGFISDTQRDEWFDNQEGLIHTLESTFNITPENTVRIPVPYNDAYRFNYLVVDMPMQTSQNEPIDYELKNTRVSRWYYFIDSMVQFAPNATELKLTLDVWTTFSHTVDIPYLMLERGHAPMLQTNVDTYLFNPIANNEYLLADDFNYGDTTVISESKYHPVGNGRKYVLFAVPLSQASFSVLGGSSVGGQSTPPTYADEYEQGEMTRWGYQLIVNNYEWKYGNVSYADSALPIQSFLNEDSVFNGNLVFAIASENATAFFNNLAETCVHLLHAIQGVFVVSEDMITLSETPFTFHNFTLYAVNKQYVVDDISLTKNDFNYPTRYRELAKLYTYPYAVLEVTDDNGFKSEVRIENTGNIEFHKEISIAFPFVRYQCFFTGFNGNKTQAYTWKNLSNANVQKTMWEDDFSSYMMNWDIPTYAVYVSSEDEYAVNNYASVAAKREGAIVDYENAVRFANTTYANTADSFDTNTDNIAASGQTNTNNVAASGATNTANTQRTTSKNVTNTAATQAGLMDNMEDENDTHDLITDTYLNGNDTFSPLADGFLPKTTWANWEKLADDGDTDWKYVNDAFNANAEYFCSTSVANGVASIFGGGSSAVGTISGASEKANRVSVAAPMIGGIASGIATTVSIPLTITKDQTLTNLQQDVIDEKLQHASTNMSKGLHAQVEYNANVKDANNDLRETIVTRFSDSNGINNANEGRDKTCEDANAYDVQTTNNVNAARTQATNNANAERTQDTETNNADWTRLAGVYAAKNNLEQVQREVAAQYTNNRLGKPIMETNYSGDAYPDVFERRGARLNVRTQTKSAIAQAGDAFLRYGYAIHRVWDMANGWHYGKHFTFWKAEDIWINEGSGLAGNAVNVIGDILLKGVTVWRNPNEIGKVSIYDNI